MFSFQIPYLLLHLRRYSLDLVDFRQFQFALFFSRYTLHWESILHWNYTFYKVVICLKCWFFFYNVLILAYDIIERKTKIPFNSSIPKLSRTTDQNHNIWEKRIHSFKWKMTLFSWCTLWTLYCLFISEKNRFV